MVVDLLIVAPQRGFSHHVPAGFIFADEVFEEARLHDTISEAQKFSTELERALVSIMRRYPRRVRLRWISPWSFAGLWVVFRFRLRTFPAVIVNHQQVLTGDALLADRLKDFVDQLLYRPA